MVQKLSASNLDTIADALSSGQLVALPTETVFGLAVSLNSIDAIDKLIKLKNRKIGSGKVFTLVPKTSADINNYVTIPERAQSFIKDYFPGPLTLILPKSPNFHHFYFDNFDEIGLRIPDFPLFTDLLPKSGPLLLTSANFRGQPTLKTPAEIIANLPVDVVVDAPAGNTPPSTILKITPVGTKIIRQGALRIDSPSH